MAIDAHAPGHPCFRFSPVVLAYVSNEIHAFGLRKLSQNGLSLGNEESDADS